MRSLHAATREQPSLAQTRERSRSATKTQHSLDKFRKLKHKQTLTDHFMILLRPISHLILDPQVSPSFPEPYQLSLAHPHPIWAFPPLSEAPPPSPLQVSATPPFLRQHPSRPPCPSPRRASHQFSLATSLVNYRVAPHVQDA